MILFRNEWPTFVQNHWPTFVQNSLVTFNDRKFLSVAQANNPLDNYMLANDETDTSESFQFNKEDSLQYAVLSGLNLKKIQFNLNHLEFAENDDPQELMDTIARMVDATLVSMSITYSLTRAVIVNQPCANILVFPCIRLFSKTRRLSAISDTFTKSIVICLFSEILLHYFVPDTALNR